MLEEIVMAGKIVEKDATVKVARQRLSVLEMAETLGNISEACRRDLSRIMCKRQTCVER